MNGTDDHTTYFLFASIGDDPVHLPVIVCPQCGALVADEALHAKHHAEVTR